MIKQQKAQKRPQYKRPTLDLPQTGDAQAIVDHCSLGVGRFKYQRAVDGFPKHAVGPANQPQPHQKR